jgi:hypothetical protein
LNFLFSAYLTLSSIFLGQTAVAPPSYCVPPTQASSSVFEYVQCLLPFYPQADPVEADFIFRHESGYDPTRLGDASFVCPVPASPLFGRISPSYGLAQINLCYHPSITVSEALSPVFAANWALGMMGEGDSTATRLWSTWRNRVKWFAFSYDP